MLRLGDDTWFILSSTERIMDPSKMELFKNEPMSLFQNVRFLKFRFKYLKYY